MNTATQVHASELYLPDRGKVGIICLMMSEAALFTIFVVAYVFYLGKSITGPYPNEVLEMPIWPTFCLLSSSMTVTFAERCLHQSKAGEFLLWLGATIVLGAEFLRQTGIEWYRLIYHHHLTISTNLFGTTYYSLVGLHATHVVLGVALLLVTLFAGLRGKTMLSQARRFEFLAWYWHFVDGIWLIVLTVVYIAGR